MSRHDVIQLSLDEFVNVLIHGERDPLLVTCTACGHHDSIQCFDVLGADDGNLICNACNTEFTPAPAHGD